MKEPAQQTVFAGLDGCTDTELPAWYAERRPVDEPTSFAEAIRDLPRAVETRVAYQNPYVDDWIETDRFNAIVEPSRLRDQALVGEPDADPLFHVPSNSYTILNPVEVYEPLEEILREETLDGRPLGEVVFGEIRQYRGGGEVHMDVLFDGLEVTLTDREGEPITMGLTSGYDFFGGHAVYVEGFAQDTACKNSIRSLTDKEIVKHVGDVEDFSGWWESILAELELVADDLFGFIEDAQDITIDFTDVPFSVMEFFELLDFPTYLAERAAGDAEANAPDPFRMGMWTLHSGATYALTHFFKGKEGNSLDRYVRTANDVLFNPEGTVERVKAEYERQVEVEETADQEGLDGERGIARIEEVSTEVQDKAEQFKEREATLRKRLITVSD